MYHTKNDEMKAELMHYGVLGMKWGVRKDQKKLGALARGKKWVENNLGVMAKSINDALNEPVNMTTGELMTTMILTSMVINNSHKRSRR